MMDLNAMKDRAMLLGINNDFIDEDLCFWMEDGKLLFFIGNHIRLTKESYIEIPEGVDIVFMNLDDTCFEDGKPYTFIFPSTCESVYGDKGVHKEGFIDFGSYINCSNKFKFSDFDFRKCKKLKAITSSFSNMSFDRLLFSETITRLFSQTFFNSKITELELPGVTNLCPKCFKSAIIRKLTLNGVIESYGVGSLEFSDLGNTQKEIVFRNLSNMEQKSLKNIDKVYMEYDSQRGLTQVQGRLANLLGRINKGNIVLSDVLQELINVNVEMTKKTDGIKYLQNIEDMIYYYVYYSSGEHMDEMKEEGVSPSYFKHKLLAYIKNLYLIDETGRGGYKFYLYKKGVSVDVHNRNYRHIVEDDDVKVYVEI